MRVTETTQSSWSEGFQQNFSSNIKRDQKPCVIIPTVANFLHHDYMRCLNQSNQTLKHKFSLPPSRNQVLEFIFHTTHTPMQRWTPAFPDSWGRPRVQWIPQRNKFHKIRCLGWFWLHFVNWGTDAYIVLLLHILWSWSLHLKQENKSSRGLKWSLHEL